MHSYVCIKKHYAKNKQQKMTKEHKMRIVVNLDVMLARRKMRLNELSERVGISNQNLSILKTGKAKAVRFSTLSAICDVLDCQPGDLLECETTEKTQSK